MVQPGAGFLLIMLSASLVVGAMLLCWTWLSNRNEKLLLYGSLALLLGASGACLIGLRGFIPLAMSVVAGNAFVIVGTCMLYAGLRIFAGRSFPMGVVIGFPALFLAAVMVPVVYETPPLRFSIASCLGATAFALCALETMRPQDGLRSRMPLGLALVVQSLMTAIRIPISFNVGPEMFNVSGYWIGVIAVEAMIFGQVVSYLAISLPKERADLELQRAALTDSLTGLPNRRAFYDFAHHGLSLAARHGHAVSLILFDLDHFKRLNDTYGHAAGDAALKTFASVMKGTLRDSDVCGRIGGEEFAAILLETNEAEATRAAERVLAACSVETLLADGHAVSLSASAGIACSPRGAESLDGLFARADRALYAAKAAGRNQVSIASTLLPAAAATAD